jgi:hypothetical protein
MPNRNKKRGYELEAETVRYWQAVGVEAKRVFASGAHKQHLGQEHAGDLMLSGYTVEAKRKKSGYKFLYDALDQDQSDMLVVKQDRHRRLYILEERTLFNLFLQAGVAKGPPPFDRSVLTPIENCEFNPVPPAHEEDADGEK